MCAVGPARRAGLSSRLAGSLRRFAYQASARIAARGAPRRIQSSRTPGHHDRWRSCDAGVPDTRHSSRRGGHLYMRRAWFVLRSAILWIFSGLHFFILAPTLVFLGIFLDPRKHDWLQRGLCNRIAFFSVAPVEAPPSPSFAPTPTLSFFLHHD